MNKLQLLWVIPTAVILSPMGTGIIQRIFGLSLQECVGVFFVQLLAIFTLLAFIKGK